LIIAETKKEAEELFNRFDYEIKNKRLSFKIIKFTRDDNSEKAVLDKEL